MFLSKGRWPLYRHLFLLNLPFATPDFKGFIRCPGIPFLDFLLYLTIEKTIAFTCFELVVIPVTLKGKRIFIDILYVGLCAVPDLRFCT